MEVTGPAGGLYAECLFQHERGEATIFVPVMTPRELGRIKPLVIPAAEVVVTTYFGSPADIDLAYARLGSYIAEHELTNGARKSPGRSSIPTPAACKTLDGKCRGSTC